MNHHWGEFTNIFQVSIKFTTDADVSENGFRLRYEADVPPGYHAEHMDHHSDNSQDTCGTSPVRLTGPQGRIISPTDPSGQYLNNIECTWKIVLPDRSSVRMISSLKNRGLVELLYSIVVSENIMHTHNKLEICRKCGFK